MDAEHCMSLVGGLALFLYGMQMMSRDLESFAGQRLKLLLQKLTASRIRGVLVGTVITGFIQSSSAVTVMTVSFVNAQIMTLRQAVWVIMGANIGTTVTGQLIALKVGFTAPVIAFIGVLCLLIFKKEKLKRLGGILSGLGVLFIGMEMMSTAMLPLHEWEGFTHLLTRFSQPVWGILAGTIFTAVIQSSSAAVGILQALASSGAISFSGAVYILFGQNIGTCITAMLAGIGTCVNAKRVAVVHLLFNIIGTILFTLLCMKVPLISWIEAWTPERPAVQIANMHTILNVVTTVVLLPMDELLVWLAYRILPENQK